MRAFLLSTTIFVTSLGVCAELPPKKVNWPFNGMLGNFDKQAAQRGFQVYKEVCSTCHNLRYLSYRHLRDLGFSAQEIKSLAKQYKIVDTTNYPEVIERPATSTDSLTLLMSSEQKIRQANSGILPPDLSLIIKARNDGANYLYSLLTGYSPLTNKDGKYHNPYFPGMWTAMHPPLYDGQVQYMDGTVSSVDQTARDVVIFLQWASEPTMEHRKSLGLKVVTYLIITIAVLYVSKQKIWARINER